LKGSYILLIEVKKNSRIRVGSLGRITFEKGLYAYVGSAMSSLEGRIKRHIRDKKKTFWHIDYLLKSKNAKITKILYKESKNKEECKVAKSVSRYGKPVIGFGSSDCKCESHLFKLRKLSEIENLGFKVSKI